jgi:hypothetical protein
VQYGPNTQVNTGALSSIGAPEQIGQPDANGRVTYKATMQGFIYTQ